MCAAGTSAPPPPPPPGPKSGLKTGLPPPPPPLNIKGSKSSQQIGPPSPTKAFEPPRYRVLHWTKLPLKEGTIWGELTTPLQPLLEPQIAALNKLFTAQMGSPVRKGAGALLDNYTSDLFVVIIFLYTFMKVTPDFTL